MRLCAIFQSPPPWGSPDRGEGAHRSLITNRMSAPAAVPAKRSASRDLLRLPMTAETGPASRAGRRKRAALRIVNPIPFERDAVSPLPWGEVDAQRRARGGDLSGGESYPSAGRPVRSLRVAAGERSAYSSGMPVRFIHTVRKPNFFAPATSQRFDDWKETASG